MFGVMKNRTIAVFILILLGIGVVLIILTATYGGNIFNHQTNGKTEEPVLALGDCVEIQYTGRYANNNTMFNTSYTNPINKTGGTPLKIFLSLNNSQPPTGYGNYSSYLKGVVEGLIGLKEGDSKTIGPIAPADAFGVFPKVGDVITLSDSSGKNITIHVLDIIPNAAMPLEYVQYYGAGNTTLFILHYDYYSIGEVTTMYPAWENATVVTKINDTLLWLFTTPPLGHRTNFTWIDQSSDGVYRTIYPENCSSIIKMNDTTIVISHNPQIGATITQVDNYYGNVYRLIVQKLTPEKINVSYDDQNTGETLYYEFNRTTMIMRNESQKIQYEYPMQTMNQVLSYIKTYYNPNLTLSVSKYADKYLLYEVHVVKIYKTS